LSSKEYQSIRRRLFCKNQKIRLAAVETVKGLPIELAKKLLIEGLSHWDATFREKNARALESIIGAESIPIIIKAREDKLITTNLAVILLSKYRTKQIETLFKTIYKDDKFHHSKLWLVDYFFNENPKEMAFERLRITKALDEKVIKVLDGQPKDNLKWFIKNMTLSWKLGFFCNRSNINYLKKRDLAGLLLEVAEAVVQKQDTSSQAIETLDMVGKEQLRKIVNNINWNDVDGERKFDKKLHDYFASRKIEYTIEHAPLAIDDTPLQPKRKPLLNEDKLRPLAEKLAIEPVLLRIAYVKWLKTDSLYRSFEMPKRNGGTRVIYAPDKYLKFIQRRIMEKILYEQELSSSCHGFRPNHSIVTNASPHIGHDYCLNLDLKDFFPSISAKRVNGLYQSFGYDRWEASFLTRLTTFGQNGHAFLPQGAPTSPAISNLICRSLDKRLSVLAAKNAMCYTRYADDLTFSSQKDLRSLIPLIVDIIKSEGFEPAKNKLRLTRKGNRQEVTGLVVNQKLSIPRYNRMKLRAIMHRLEKGEDIHISGNPLSLDALKGHLSFLKSVQPELGKKYLDQLTQISKNQGA